METTTKTTLSDLIQSYIKAKEENEEFKKLPALIKPVLKKAYTITEYNAYTEALTKYYIDGRVRQAHCDLAEKTFSSLRKKVLDTLPTTHVWFLSEDGKHAIAIQCSDWPMDPPKIIVIDNPVTEELPQLKLQHVSAN